MTERNPVRGRGSFASWLLLLTFSLGLFALWSRASGLVPILIAVGYLGLLIAFIKSIISWRDVFNPFCLILFIGFVRYSCPALLLLSGTEPPNDAARFYQQMGLLDSDWIWAHVLALTSLAGVALGWLTAGNRGSKSSPLQFHFPRGISHAAFLAMVAGLAALVVFIVENASLSAIVTGAIRGTNIQVGTGIYFRLTYLLIVGSILLCGYLIQRNEKRIALIPVLVAAAALLTLGGRGRASIPLLAGLLLRWYQSRERSGWPAIRFKLRYALIVPAVLVLAVWPFYFGALYRGGYGLSAIPLSLSLQGIWQYIQYSIFVDAGQLHALAGAVAIGPGVLGGGTFFTSLSWPLSKWLPIPGRSAGVFIIETLVGLPGEHRWGVNASLIGDAYLNFGLLGIMTVMPVFGILMKLVYSKFRTGRLNAAIYAFVAVYGTGLFLKSIEAWGDIFVGLVFMVVIIRFARFFQLRTSELRADMAAAIAAPVVY